MNQLPEFDTRPVAFFDFDGTLTTGDTLMPFLKFVVGKPTYYAKLALLSPVLGAYYAKLLRNDIAKQIVLKQYLGGYHIDELFRFGERFSEEVIPTMLRLEGMERLRWHQAQGHECVLVSASMNVYLESWAKRERFSDVICTALEVGQKGHVSGKIQGKNCHGDEKARRIVVSKLNSRRLTYAYGDSKGDWPMLKLVDHGFVFERGAFSVSSI
ncbi:HAD-IB family hydrolase [Chromohalobacter canadensis]|uniref:HAD-IB family hydrolase n=1 Tax=Chromohalobacter canadensis TaxID=141389 RepID=A0ABZ0YA72_9GAMM|nr:HAD-IB family hydrolase [Chromohalobacter canadensis]MCK0769399.1 HAD-IB family hydrolase [Chromohalobacter canadensis]WQH08971.1 HAD-IB family hydrolase [Chromohalobacter canadensis]